MTPHRCAFRRFTVDRRSANFDSQAITPENVPRMWFTGQIDTNNGFRGDGCTSGAKAVALVRPRFGASFCAAIPSEIKEKRNTSTGLTNIS